MRFVALGGRNGSSTKMIFSPRDCVDCLSYSRGFKEISEKVLVRRIGRLSSDLFSVSLYVFQVQPGFPGWCHNFDASQNSGVNFEARVLWLINSVQVCYCKGCVFIACRVLIPRFEACFQANAHSKRQSFIDCCHL